jgi:hypothetical protein
MFQPFRKSNPVQIEPYTDEQLKLGASQQALDLLASVTQADQALAALPESEQITNGNTDCYLCPQCKFGPVAHSACADLTSHHAQGGVSNKCPKCGFFGSCISEWIQISAPRQPTFNRPAIVRGRAHNMERLVDLRNMWAHAPRRGWVYDEPTVFVPTVFAPRRWMPDPVTVTVGVDLSGLFEGRDPWLLAPSYWDEVTRRLMQTAMQAGRTSLQALFVVVHYQDLRRNLVLAHCDIKLAGFGYFPILKPNTFHRRRCASLDSPGLCFRLRPQWLHWSY